MFRIRKRFKFEAAHVLDSSYSSDCQNLHGHSYIVEVFCESDNLNGDGMVIDFGKIKDAFGYKIQEWDHAVIISHSSNFSCNTKTAIMMLNPTAENMAQELFYSIKNVIPELCKVRVHETETGYAEYEETK